MNPIITHHLDCLGVDCEWRADEVRAYIENIISAAHNICQICTHDRIFSECSDCEDIAKLFAAIEGKEFTENAVNWDGVPPSLKGDISNA